MKDQAFGNVRVFKIENKNNTIRWKGEEVGTLREIVDMYGQ